MAIRIDLSAPLNVTFAEQAAFAKRAEELGFAGVGIADHLEYGRDAYVALTMAALQTSRIELYPAVTSPLTRHPFVLASVANSIAELAPGRFKVGIGTGDNAAIRTGQRPSTLRRLRETVETMRALLHGESVVFGEGAKERILTPASPPPPLMLTASGPRAIALAGEVADEALLLAGLDDRLLANALGHLAEGANRAGRSPDDIPVTHYTMVSIDDDASLAREHVRPWLAVWLREKLFQQGLDAIGVRVPLVAQGSDIPDALLAELCGLLFIVGTPNEVAERFQRLPSQGVERVACLAPGGAGVRERTMELLAEHVLRPRPSSF